MAIQPLEDYSFPMAESTIQRGMTKREHFAVKILSGMMANDNAWAANRYELARDAVKSADALLLVLEE